LNQPVRLRGWTNSREGRIVPILVGRAMVERANRFDVANGGRFDVRNDRTIILWPADKHPDGGRGAPIASFAIRWGQPTSGQAVIHRLAWDAEACSVLELRHAVDLLRGTP
jgi:hypothetical protein